MTTLTKTDIRRADRLKATIDAVPEDHPSGLRPAVPWNRFDAVGGATVAQGRGRAIFDDDDDLFDNVPI